jgi:hypothetical protein
LNISGCRPAAGRDAQRCAGTVFNKRGLFKGRDAGAYGMKKELIGTSDAGQAFRIFDVCVNKAGEITVNPVIEFTLATASGSERFQTEVIDGYLPREDGCWIDQRSKIDFENEEDVSDMLYAVNSAIESALAEAKEKLAMPKWAVEATAEVMGLCVNFEEAQGNMRWVVRQPNGNNWRDLFRAASLHEVEAELNQMLKSYEPDEDLV